MAAPGLLIKPLSGLHINYLLGVRVPWSLPGLQINYLLGVRVPWSHINYLVP